MSAYTNSCSETSKLFGVRPTQVQTKPGVSTTYHMISRIGHSDMVLQVYLQHQAEYSTVTGIHVLDVPGCACD